MRYRKPLAIDFGEERIDDRCFKVKQDVQLYSGWGLLCLQSLLVLSAEHLPLERHE